MVPRIIIHHEEKGTLYQVEAHTVLTIAAYTESGGIQQLIAPGTKLNLIVWHGAGVVLKIPFTVPQPREE
jgi:hypothetical protein